MPAEGDHLHHISDRDVLGEANHQADTGVGRFHDGVGGKTGRHRDQADIGICRFHGGANCVKDGFAFEPFAALPRCDATDDIGTVIHHQFGMESALPPGDALHQYFGAFVNENRHFMPAPLPRRRRVLLHRSAFPRT